MHPTDTRATALIDAHSVLALELLHAERQRQARRWRALKAAAPVPIPYKAWIELDGFLDVGLSADLYAPDAPETIVGQFTGSGGGTLVGEAQLWGSGWLYEALEEGTGNELSFAAHFMPGLLTIVWWDEKGPFATLVGNGPGEGGGLFGGTGKFTVKAQEQLRAA